MIQIIIQIEQVNNHIGAEISIKDGKNKTGREALAASFFFDRLNKTLSSLMGVEPNESTVANTSDSKLNGQIIESAKERLRRRP